ncbi:hypothetical protein SALBM311S_07016 [Streptomyces alboniger]
MGACSVRWVSRRPDGATLPGSTTSVAVTVASSVALVPVMVDSLMLLRLPIALLMVVTMYLPIASSQPVTRSGRRTLFARESTRRERRRCPSVRDFPDRAALLPIA